MLIEDVPVPSRFKDSLTEDSLVFLSIDAVRLIGFAFQAIYWWLAADAGNKSNSTSKTIFR